MRTATIIGSAHQEVVQVFATIRGTVMVRVWRDGVTSADDGGILADVELGRHQVRALLAALEQEVSNV